jgi:hypothetical protein
MDRLLSQCQQMMSDTEGGLFVMIGRKPPLAARRPLAA